ncbi:MAG: 2,3-bisphosphoglycerate-independent phosphoglycerate mutase [Candidatus Kerfeldbacteria bacterium]|nr:2,3-bisphosphoglycerate-independent phosphoglycerate mutase [Candidatus Kerfeldbacteria bacterium]
MPLKRRPLVLLILDGWGVAPKNRGNAIMLAETPAWDRFVTTYPSLTLQASGESVGLPWGEMGNSEVGHMNIGAGKILYRDLPRINRAILDGSFYERPAFDEAIKHVKQTKGQLHLVGLLSSGGIHSFNEHAYALLELAGREKMANVFIHVMLDGRDTPHNSGETFITKLEAKLKELKLGAIATIAGRFWAMDRDNRWDRIQKAYRAMTAGTAEETFTDPLVAVRASYGRGIYDEEFVPTVITSSNGQPRGTIRAGDSVIFFNFRADRARELTKAFVLPGFMKFERSYLRDIIFVTMTEYEQNLPVLVAFPPEIVTTPLAKVISDLGEKQLHLAETEKYAHVTFFLNGGREEPFPGESRSLVPSPSVSTYDQKPEMSAREITDRAIKEINSASYGFVVINYANADMVGHTGNIPATVKAIESIDAELDRLAAAVVGVNGILVITADHGNAEEKLNLTTGFINKEHTANPVPFVLIGSDWQGHGRASPDLSTVTPSGILADVAPTLLDLESLLQPPEMTGRSLRSLL